MRRRTSACDARNQLETSSCSCGLVLARRPSTSGRETGSDARLPSGSTANGTSGSPATEGVAQALQGVVPTRRTSRPARPRIRCLACGQPASSPDAKTLTRSPRGNARLPTLPSAWSSTWPWKPLSEYSSKTPISPKGGQGDDPQSHRAAYAKPGQRRPRCTCAPRDRTIQIVAWRSSGWESADHCFLMEGFAQTARAAARRPSSGVGADGRPGRRSVSETWLLACRESRAGDRMVGWLSLH